MKSEVAFLVGAGRSGSTLLYKLLCLHSDVAYISNYDIKLPPACGGLMTRWAGANTRKKLGAWFSSAGNAYFVDRPLQLRLFPTPVEGERVYERCGVVLHSEVPQRANQKTVECMRKRFSSICRRMGGRLIVSKRTANNRRIGLLREIFPDAKFINLVRDGRDVALSLSRVEWWPGHTVWWDGRTAMEMESDGIDRLLICARNWVRETMVVSDGLSSSADVQVLTVRYEDLVREPGIVMSSVCKFLGLHVSQEFFRAIESVGLIPRPNTWASEWTAAQIAVVEDEQRELLQQIGYLG